MASLQLTNSNLYQLLSSSSSVVCAIFGPMKHFNGVIEMGFCTKVPRRSWRCRTQCSSSIAPMESSKIKVVDVGRGGNNDVNSMIGSDLQVDFLFSSTLLCFLFKCAEEMEGSEEKRWEWGVGVGPTILCLLETKGSGGCRTGWVVWIPTLSKNYLPSSIM